MSWHSRGPTSLSPRRSDETEKERRDLTIKMLGEYLQLPITPWPELFPDCGRQRPDAADVDKVRYNLLCCHFANVIFLQQKSF